MEPQDTAPGNIRRPRRSSGTGSLQGKNSDTARECLDNATRYEQRAASVVEPAAKDTFAAVARCWRELARCWSDLPSDSSSVKLNTP
jgi:hypothetical protein